MPQHTVTWEGGRRFTGRTADGRESRFDVPVAMGGDGTAPSPMEAVLHALAACSAVDVVAILEKMRCPPDTLRVEVSAERAADHPKVYTSIDVLFVVTGEVPEKKLARAIDLSAGTFCSVGAMLGATARITHRFELR